MFMTMLHLYFKDRTLQGPHFHLTTVEWRRNLLLGMHDHDYREIFWLTQGECEHRINGVRQMLREGEMVLMREADVHCLRPVKGRGFRFTNLSISPGICSRLERQYPEECRYLYANKTLPLVRSLSRGGLGEINEEMRDLAGGPHTQLALERAVLNLWNRFLPRGRLEEGTVSDWLRDALVRLEEPEVLSLGVSGLVDVAGRSAAHVSRECRRTMGKTPTELVNAARMRRAAHLLRMTSRSVLEISGDCGYKDPAQFHRIFKNTYGVPPGRYRREERSL